MALEIFIPKKFRKVTLGLIEQANGIIREYRAQGFILTVRQMFYQFVARDLLPNSQKKYELIGRTLNNGRLAGLIDWDAIEDRTRNVREPATWENPADILGAVGQQYREDLWRSQPFRPRVWIEKDALLGVIEPACERWRVPYFACRGSNSQSEQYKAGKQFAAELAQRPNSDRLPSR